MCGGFSSINWKSSGEFQVDTKCFIFSLKLPKVYKRQNDIENIYFNPSYGPYFGANGALGIGYDNKLFSACDQNPFLVPKNA